MSCGITDLGGCAKEGAQSAIEALAHALADACSWMIKESFTWWIQTDPTSVNSNIVTAIRNVTTPLSIAIALAGVIVVGIKMSVSGKPDPLVPLGTGLFKLAFWTTTGTIVINSFMKYSSAFSGWILDQSAGRKFGQELEKAFGFGSIFSILGAVIVLGILGFLAGVVQWIIGLMREGSVTILTGLLPLAAAGELAGFGKAWMPKIFGWCLALIFWQPCAALVYFTAFHFIKDSRDGQDTLVGIAMMVLALFTLPALIKLFSWATNSVMESGGGGGLMGAAALTAAGLRAKASSGGGAQTITARQQSEQISRSLGEQREHPYGASPSSSSRTASRDGQATPGTAGAPGRSQANSGTPSTGAAPTKSTGDVTANAASKAGTAASGASKAVPYVGIAVTAAQTAKGAAQSGANKMVNPPTDAEQ